jgi:hypothetical protein
MDMAHELDSLRAGAVRDLEAAHDFFEHTSLVWQTFEAWVSSGNTLKAKSITTGTIVTQTDLVALAPRYKAEFLLAFTFQHFISVFETFVFGLSRLALIHNPRALSKRQVEVSALLEAADKETVIADVIDKALNDLKYGALREWFVYLDGIVKLGCPSAEETDRLAEMKAARDILVHNAGVANATYVRKSGPAARFNEGDRVDISPEYHNETWTLVRKVIDDVSSAAKRRLAKKSP